MNRALLIAAFPLAAAALATVVLLIVGVVAGGGDVSRDPVFQDDDGKWNFWDEAWAYGPYDTEDEARAALDDYCKNELGIE